MLKTEFIARPLRTLFTDSEQFTFFFFFYGLPTGGDAGSLERKILDYPPPDSHNDPAPSSHYILHTVLG